MNKIISFTFLSLCISTQSITMDRDRVGSNQKQHNEHLSRTTESPTRPRTILQDRKEKQKQNTLKRSQERHKKYSDDYNK